MIFFTSDHHFGHGNIIGFRDRPFRHVRHMDESLLHRWNEVVAPDDLVYHLGDIAVHASPESYMRRANGRKVLIVGNHDKGKYLEMAGLFEAVHDVLYIKEEGRYYWLSHYPHESWKGSGHGSYHLHGHIHRHGNEQPRDRHRRLNVNVEFHDYYPLSLPQVMAIFDQKETP